MARRVGRVHMQLWGQSLAQAGYASDGRQCRIGRGTLASNTARGLLLSKPYVVPATNAGPLFAVLSAGAAVPLPARVSPFMQQRLQ